MRGAVDGVRSGDAHAETSPVGAVGAAAKGGITGSVQGAVDGVRSGIRSGTASTPAAAWTIAALGATGLVGWPIAVVLGGAVRSPSGCSTHARHPNPPTQHPPTPPRHQQNRRQRRRSLTCRRSRDGIATAAASSPSSHASHPRRGCRA
ncbi:Hypothetical protein WSS_A07659 [Rhodococcus opacus M213]|uniref:Uncharacterized protein n=1 Tax=Rhodococcus opacus M213 TaxID=1129896 RepID=K8XPF8_RHOOP|nr:Hypothetical protein WSS_A07659 [Rhodococcus opacus M213]